MSSSRFTCDSGLRLTGVESEKLQKPETLLVFWDWFKGGSSEWMFVSYVLSDGDKIHAYIDARGSYRSSMSHNLPSKRQTLKIRSLQYQNSPLWFKPMDTVWTLTYVERKLRKVYHLTFCRTQSLENYYFVKKLKTWVTTEKLFIWAKGFLMSKGRWIPFLRHMLLKSLSSQGIQVIESFLWAILEQTSSIKTRKKQKQKLNV